MKDFGIFGTSGMAREVGDIAAELGYRPIYIAKDQLELDQCTVCEEAILEGEVESLRHVPFAIGIGDNNAREKVVHRYQDILRFNNLIHPSATFGRAQRGALENQQGIIICAGVRFTNNVQVGDFTIINLNVTVSHDVIVDPFSMLAPGVNISGNVHIGARCWIGAGATVNHGTNETRLHIGSDTVIGSGALVLTDCLPNAVYAGVPAKRIK
jgi:sugar O-acyltransferase (sialic acid O-acetyltransferase NeuD family)